MQKKMKGIFKKSLAVVMTFLMFLSAAPIVTAAPETLPNGYVIDMEALPKVHFPQHPEWEEIYHAAWQMHKSNIKKANLAINPNDVYFVDEAFNEEIYAWDTMFMMLFDKYGYNQFPTLEALDNFYFSQYDSENYSVGEVAGELQQGEASSVYYNSEGEHHNGGIKNKPELAVAKSPAELQAASFFESLNQTAATLNGAAQWTIDAEEINGGFPVFADPPKQVEGASSFAGAGSSTDPYLITSAADLATLAELVNSGTDSGAGKFYQLTENIQLSGDNNFVAIGTETNRFQGTFDGGFHTVSGIRIKTDKHTQGLFGYLYNGTVKNVGVVDLVIYSDANSAAIAGQAKGDSRILNCFVRNAYLHTENSAVGGIAGLLEGTSRVENCYVTDTFVGGRSFVGGLVGLIRSGTPVVKNCYSSANVIFNGDGYIFRKRYESNGTTYYDYTNVLGLNPPLWAWAEWEQYQIHGDISRFTKEINGKTIFQRIIDHFFFIEREKKMENGLYGKTSGDANGLDDSPNQDYPWVTATGGKGEQTYNDLSIQQAQLAYYISIIANEIGDTETAEYFTAEHQRISTLINDLMWDEEETMYSNLDVDGVTHTNISTPTNLWALAGHVATEETAESIIHNHALNSEKLFRPSGLATLAYDYPGDSNGRSAYSPKGKYWNGSVWAPTSYQYIRGLNEYGYDDLAFQEAIRHVNMVYDVYQEGYNGLNSIWECYSPDYTRPATTKGDSGNSRSNFVGWTGCLAIGIVIEDILGLDVNGPDNTITWTPHLSEENGISDLWYSHKGVENTVDLLAEKRDSASDALTFTVRADQDFTLIVNNNGVTETIAVTAGTHTYTVDGTNGEKSYLDAVSIPLDLSDDSLTPSEWEKTLDYVVFQNEKNESISDGLPYQTGKVNGLIYNVNTIGYRENSSQNPLSLRDSATMQSLGFVGAQDLVRKNNSAGNEGFMLMAPADNAIKTIKLLVGVKNTTATLTASLSDASQPELVQQLSGGKEEATYLITIPYRAASADKNLYLEYRIDTNASSDAEITLKGIALLEGGTTLPAVPENLIVTPGDKSLTVDATLPEGERYDNFVIYAGTDPSALESYTTSSLPYNLTGIENFETYYVAVAGIRDGVSSRVSNTVSTIPEPTGMSDYDRANVDLDRALTAILNGNTGLEDIRSSIKMETVGPVYGSKITVTSSTAEQEYGIMADGTVHRSIAGNISAQLVLQAAYQNNTYDRNLSATVRMFDPTTEAFVAGSSYPFNGTVNLTSEGSTDWAQFSTKFAADYAKKDTDTPSITNFKHLDSSYTEVAGDVPMKYIVTDAAAGTQPDGLKGIVSKFLGNGFEFNLPYREHMQKVKIYAGVYRATGKVELLINDQVMFTDYVSENATSLTINSFKAFDINFQATNPDDVITVRYTMTQSFTSSGNGGSLILPAVTLQDTEEQAVYPVSPVQDTRIEAEHYVRKGTQTANKEVCQDVDGGLNVGSINAGESLTYYIDVEKGGTYDLAFRIAAKNAVNPNMSILLDGQNIGNLTDTVVTGGWQTWKDFTVKELTLPAGRHTLKLNFGASGTNLNYLTFTPVTIDEPRIEVSMPDTIIKNEEFELTLRTDTDYEKLILLNENGRKVSFKVVSKTIHEDGSVSTVLRMWIGTVGVNRTLSVFDGTQELGSFSFDVLNIPTGIKSVEPAQPNAQAGEFFEVTMVTTPDLIKAVFYNETGRGIGRELVRREVKDGLMISVYRLMIATPGDRTIVAKADKDKQSEYPFAMDFQIQITPRG